MTGEPQLYRVWFARKETPQYDLVRASSTDEVYRSFKKAKRETITRVELVVKSSEARALEAIGAFLRAGGRRTTKRRAA